MGEIEQAMIDLEYLLNNISSDIHRQVKSRGLSAANILKNKAREVLSGSRSGKVYKKPGTYGKTASKETRKLKKDYGHKLRGGQLYRASAPGEPPAVRIGTLRSSFNKIRCTAEGGQNSLMVRSSVESTLKVKKYLLGDLLDQGTSKMAARPFKEKIKELAMPEIKDVYDKPYV